MKSLIKLIIFIVLFFLNSISAEEKNILEPVKTLPVFDGKVDEIYKSGILFNSFKQLQPYIFADPTVKTEIFFLYDSENIYIAGSLYQPKSTIKSSNGRKDSPIILDGDAVGIVIDPLNNGNSAYFFSINPSNAVVDGTLDANGNWDFKWDAIFNSATVVENDFWSFELFLPLSSINFQDKDEQDWGILFRREFAQNREIILSSLIDKNQPFSINNFAKIKKLKGLKKENKLFITPYSFFSYKNNSVIKQNENKMKVGGEIKYNPISSMTILATFNPDFAQVETDKLIINVDDVPTSYPEKRPFFTESSDLYPGLAVNTRNIQNIDVGIKIRDVKDNFKYDLTWVIDRQQNKWYMGDLRLTDNTSYYVDLISGIKNAPDRTDYNVTANLRTWFFNKKLTAYTWFGTINKQNSKNEYESVNSIRWVTRELTIGFWNHFKTKYYNPNITGHNTLSNESLFHFWGEYSCFNENGFFRVVTPKIKYEFNGLYSNPGKYYNVLNVGFSSTMHLNEMLGNWDIEFNYTPAMKKNFRYRELEEFKDANIHEDAFSNFVLIDQKKSALSLIINSDYSKSLGFKAAFDNKQVRKSSAENFTGEIYWKIAPTSVITYSLSFINLYGSEYQIKYKQIIHIIKAEYNITEKINIKALFQLNNIKMTNLDYYKSNNPIFNVTVSWEYLNGSYLYIVYNKQRFDWNSVQTPKSVNLDDQSIAFKINSTLNIY